MSKAASPYPQGYQRLPKATEIASFLTANPDHRISYTNGMQPELFSVQTFHVDGTFSFVSDNGRLINKSSDEYSILLDCLITRIDNWKSQDAIAGLNQIAEKAMEVNSTSVCMKPCKSKSLEDQLESNKVAELEKAIAKLNSKTECYDKALDFDNKAIADLTLKVATLQSDLDKLKDTVIPSVNAIAPQYEDVASSTFVIHLTHCDRRYEAFWREGYGSFYTCEVGSDGELGFVGHVEIEKDQSWTNEIFLSVSKSVISAYLKGLQSYHNNRF